MVQFDPQSVHDLAADMFWLYADELGFAAANKHVLETEGYCLLEYEFDNSLFRKHPIKALPDDNRIRFLEAVAAEATLACEEGRNLLGTIYRDDLIAGRSPDAMHIETGALNVVPTWRCSHPLERMGSLCIRHPLPAVVAAPSLPQTGLIEIADTSAALGFQMPMFLQVTQAGQVDTETYFLGGYFIIPVPTEEQGDRWDATILNSLRTVSGMTFEQPTGAIHLDFEWSTAPSARRGSAFAAFKRLFE